jgi:hypothetical protein
MTIDRLRDLLQTLRFELRRTLGVPGLVGGLALGAAVLAWSSVPAVESATRDLLYSARQARSAKARQPDDAVRASVDAHSLDNLPDLFSTFAASGDDIALIFAHAQQNHLTLGSAQYQVTAEPGARFTRYQVLLPVKDQYGTIRRFVASILNSVPNAALQEIHVERPAVDGNVLDARIRFDLIYRTSRP